jgi:hypothetical protein
MLSAQAKIFMTIQDEAIYSNVAEDYTLPPGDTKRDILLARDDIDSYSDELDDTENSLTTRANRHFCANYNNFGVYIADANSYNAVATGWNLLYNGQYRTSASGRVYPHQFYNNERIADVYRYCPNGPWYGLSVTFLSCFSIKPLPMHSPVQFEKISSEHVYADL